MYCIFNHRANINHINLKDKLGKFLIVVSHLDIFINLIGYFLNKY
ncbi:hypothetical protein MCRH_0447 [Moraxella catarrhalis RH4]|nr:hypothetical protein MCRH_0447 [Moraxella catarrhalis RH4]